MNGVACCTKPGLPETLHTLCCQHRKWQWLTTSLF